MAKKILVADDDPDCRAILQTILGQEGFDVITAEDGHEAVETAEQERPDLILLDVVMETYTAGGNAIARLRDSQLTRKIPVILVTGVDLTGSQTDTSDQQNPMMADGYIRKPVDPERLLATIRALLGEG